MEGPQVQLSLLKELRAREEERRDVRRLWRSRYLSNTQADRYYQSRRALQRDLRRHSLTTSLSEQQLLTALGNTAQWWDALCDHSIQQKLQNDIAERSKTLHHASYLETVQEREKRELVNLVESDCRRWDIVREQFQDGEAALRREAVDDSINAIVTSVSQCIDYLREYNLSGRDNVLAQFALRELSLVGTAEGSPPVRAMEVFEHIYGCSRIPRASEPFLNLVKLLYLMSDSTEEKVTSLFEVTSVPIIAINGPVFSGKSLLSEFLSTAFTFKRFSDRALVQKALQVYETEKDAIEAFENFSMKQEEDAAADAALVAATAATGAEEQARGTEAAGDMNVSGSPPSPPPLRAVGSVPSLATTRRLSPSNTEYSASRTGTGRGKRLSIMDPASRGRSKNQFRLSQWALIGQRIRQLLMSGKAIDSGIITQLVMEELRELRDAGSDESAGCHGIIFDGLITRPEEYKDLHRSLLPEQLSQFTRLMSLWCGDADTGELKREKKSLGDKKPPVPPEWLITKASLEEPVNKKETKPRASKKNVDLSTLPAADLPVVEDTADALAAEKQFVEEAREQLEAVAGVFSSVIHIECRPEEVFRRYAGLRVDKATGEEYHLVYRPPPPDRLPYLVNLDRTHRYTAQLHDVLFEQQQRWASLERSLAAQGMSARIANLRGENTMEAVCEESLSVVREAQRRYREGRDLFMRMRQAENHIVDLLRQREDQLAAREAERKRLAAVYQEKGVALPPILEQEVNEKIYCEFPSKLPEFFLDCVSAFSEQYTGSYEETWQDLAVLVRLLLDYHHETGAKMHEFWSFPDDKQDKVDRFCALFNSVPTALRNKTSCKEELHLLTDELSDSLYASVATKQKACLSLIDRVTKRETYLDGWQASVGNTAIAFAQIEVERFAMTANLVLTYFTALTGEPYMFEEVDSEVPSLKPSAEVAKEEQQANPKAKERKSQGSKKGHGKAEEATEKTAEELLRESLDKVVASLAAFVDRFRAVCEVSTKGGGQKKGVTAATLRAAAVATKCVPVLDAELKSTTARIRAIERFIDKFLREGDAYVQLIKSQALESAQAMFAKQAAAVNSAVFAIHTAVERERTVPAMHLGCGTFSLDAAAAAAEDDEDEGEGCAAAQRRSFLTDVPLYQTEPEQLVWVQQGLSSRRLLEVIRTFRCVAPNYQLPWSEFALVVRPEDYAFCVSPGKTAKSLAAVFREFDFHDTGVIDWREWIVHLLFWCCPPAQRSYYVPEITIEQLLETKADVGFDAVDEETFFDLPLFFDAFLGDVRLEAYTAALWETFSSPSTATLEPYVLLSFLCADVQPVRGAQKAFYVLSQENDGRLTAEELEGIFHMKANNPRALGLEDPFSSTNIKLLYRKSDKVMTFNDCCGCAMGRKMLNSTDAFRRKLFTNDV